MSMTNETLTMAGIVEDGNSKERTTWFAPDSCVEREGDYSRVFVGGYLIGEFQTGDTVTRNLIRFGSSVRSYR